MRELQALFAALLLVALGMIGIWDTVALYRDAPGSTVSSILYAWSRENPILPLAVGVMVGHLFWP